MMLKKTAVLNRPQKISTIGLGVEGRGSAEEGRQRQGKDQKQNLSEHRQRDRNLDDAQCRQAVHEGILQGQRDDSKGIDSNRLDGKRDVFRVLGKQPDKDARTPSAR